MQEAEEEVKKKIQAEVTNLQQEMRAKEEGDEYMKQGLSDTNDKLRTVSANQVGWILQSLTTLAKSETKGVLERDCEVLGVFLRIMNILSLDFQDKEAARDALPGMYAFDVLKEGGNNEK